MHFWYSNRAGRAGASIGGIAEALRGMVALNRVEAVYCPGVALFTRSLGYVAATVVIILGWRCVLPDECAQDRAS